MNEHEKINYVEFPSNHLEDTRHFFEQVFNWTFQDFGPDYIAFLDQGIDGGFFKADMHSSTGNGAALIIFYSKTLEATQTRIEQAGGNIIKPIYSFPGGRRFHFTEPGGNEFAVWSDKE